MIGLDVMQTAAAFFKKSYNLLAESAGKRGFLSTILTDLSQTHYIINVMFESFVDNELNSSIFLKVGCLLTLGRHLDFTRTGNKLSHLCMFLPVLNARS